MLELIKPHGASPEQTTGSSVKFRPDLEENTMPVDFASYLLSSSPPGFDLNYTLREHFGVNLNRGRSLRLKPPAPDNRPVHKSGSLPDLRDSVLCPKQTSHQRETHSDDDDGGADFKEDKNTCKQNATVPKSKMGKKKVSFADDCGKSLVSVRLMTESSDTPPQLRSQILFCLTQGATAGITETPPLMLNFSQPASNYMAFREKINKNCVSLENVILKDYNLIGTIKVKNIAFEKSVKVRCTFDSWETTQDFPATYVPNGQTNFDTFAFDIKVPPKMNVQKKVQFCICYMANGQEFWDSNDGTNYEVVSANWKALSSVTAASQNTTDKAVYDLYAESDWTEFSGWNDMDDSCPYW